MKSISRDTVLTEIFNRIQQIDQWHSLGDIAYMESCLENHYNAEALIELLEVADCGSTGGFDKGQPIPQTLFDRFEWLYNKHKATHIKKADIDEMREVFRRPS